MSDTIRTQTALLATLFADGQGPGEITPQDMRDLIVSLRSNQGNGWAYNADDARALEVDAVSISAGVRTLLLNDGAGATTDVSQIGLLGANIWNTSTNKIMPAIAGDSYDVRIEFNIKKTTSNNAHLSIDVDIGGSIGILATDTRVLIKGSGIRQCMMFPYPIFVGSTFIENGGEIYITPSVDIEYWGATIFIVRTHTPTT